MSKVKYHISMLDVWGNKDDGYEVNNVLATGHSVWLEEYPLDSMTDLSILRRVAAECGFSRTRNLEVSNQSENEIIYIDAKDDGMPIYQLHRAEED